MKSRLRKFGERTVEGLWNRIGQLVGEVLPEECRAFMGHAGYTVK